MAEGDAHVVNNAKEQLLLGTIHFGTDVLKMALYSDVYSSTMIDGAAPAYSATNEIAPGGSYTAGGQSVGTCVVSQDDTNDWAKLDDDGTDVTWAALPTATIQRAVLYDDTTATKWLLIMWEIATNSNGGDYTLQFGTNGILTLV